MVRRMSDSYSRRRNISSATIETIRVATGAPVIQVKAGPKRSTSSSHRYQIKTDPNGQIWLRWNKQFERISVVDKFDIVQGKTVILGITAEGIGLVIATPNGERYSMIHCSRMQTIQAEITLLEQTMQRL